MRAAIVSSAALARYGRMDAGYYLGVAEKTRLEADVARARQAVRRAVSRLRTAQTHQKAAEARLAALVASGDVVPLPVPNVLHVRHAQGKAE